MNDKDKQAAMLDRKNGRPVEVGIGTVIESDVKGARSPLVVYAVFPVKMGDTTLVEYALATKDRVSLTKRFTAFQLKRYGYKAVGVAGKFDPKSVREPDTKIVVELVPVLDMKGKQIGADFVPKTVPNGKPPESGKQPESAKPEPETPPKPPHKGRTPKGEGKETGEKPEAVKARIRDLLDKWVWGVAPDNFKEIEAELRRLGVDTKRLADAISEIINKTVETHTTGGE